MRICLAAAAAMAISASAAQADIVALTDSNMLAMIDTTSGKVTGKTKIDGIGPVLGIDVRPSDGMLYALAADGTVVTIDAKTGKATIKSKLDTTLPAGVKVTVDFNPVADRMRIIGSDGTNLRANVDDGKVTKDKTLAFAETDAAKGKTPMIVAGGYTNSMKGAKETTLYDIDAALGGLFRQAPPNDGVLNTIGMLGVDAKGAAFDIMTDASGTNTAMLVAGKMLYSVDLASGKSMAGKTISDLPGEVTDIAVMPAM
jgi:DNA-binding beta-propeller fold protein YncE